MHLCNRSLNSAEDFAEIWGVFPCFALNLRLIMVSTVKGIFLNDLGMC